MPGERGSACHRQADHARANHQNLHVSAARSYGPFDGLFEVTWNAERYDSDINTFARTRLPSYTLARLALSWPATEKVKLTLRIENLTTCCAAPATETPTRRHSCSTRRGDGCGR